MPLSNDERRRRVLPGQPVYFRNPQHEAVAWDILEKSKAAKLETLPASSRIFISKSKQLTFDEKDISAALASVMNRNGSPGVVEVLRDLLLQQHGDINFCRKKSTNIITAND
jgi:hypothetical protein